MKDPTLGRNQGVNNPMYGRRLCGKANGMYGKTHTKEARLKISRARKGKPQPKQRGDKNHFWGGGSRAYYSRIATRVWKKYWNEEVPEKHLIHHFDRNYTNNEITNLVLSDYSWHTRIHPAKNKRRRQVDPYEILLQEI